MEWFWQIVEHLQKSTAASLLRSFALTDWIILIAIFWGWIQGGRKGFSDMFGKLLAISLVSVLTLSFYPGIAAFLIENLSGLSQTVAEPFSFLMLAVFLGLSVTWCINLFGKLFTVEAQGIFKTLGGVIFGVLRMILLLSFLSQFLLLLPIKPLQQIFKPGRTYAGYTISRFVPDLHKLVMTPFQKSALKESMSLNRAGG